MNKGDRVRIIDGPFAGNEGVVYTWSAGTGAKGLYSDIMFDRGIMFGRGIRGVYNHNIEILDDSSDYVNDLE